MTPKYIAVFEYGRAKLTRVYSAKETEKTIKVARRVNFIGNLYLSDVIRKASYDIFPDVQMALDFLITKAELHRGEMEKAVAQAAKQVDDLMELARKLKEGQSNGG